MECRMRTRVREMVENLAREYQRELAAVGTFVALEELTAEIGDEFGRQLCENELLNRARRAANVEHCECPECGLLCPRGEPEAMLLQGLRGEVAFSQPSYFCQHCRRSFFPSGGAIGTAGAEYGDAKDVAEDGLGGKQSGQLRDGRRGHARVGR
jgi:hypothetical protein